MTPSTPLPLATLEAVLERITYANEETGYTVARVATRGSEDLITVVGNLRGAQPGESLRMQGVWKSHQWIDAITRRGYCGAGTGMPPWLCPDRVTP